MNRAVTLRCHAWTCDLCRPYRKRRLIAEVQAGAPQRLLTLTLRHTDNDDPDQQARFLGLAWARLRRKVERERPGAITAYFAVREAHKSGYPHLHVALRGDYIPWADLSRWWEEITGSPGVDIRKIWRPHSCAKYVAKYLGKDPHRFGTCKRYWRSKNWLAPIATIAPGDDGWSRTWWLDPRDLQTLAKDWDEPGALVMLDRDHLLVEYQRGPP